MSVLASVGHDPPLEFAAAGARPDVVEVYRQINDPACGFDFDVQLPEAADQNVPIAIAFTDGDLLAKTPAFRIRRTEYPGTAPTKVALARSHLRGVGVEFGALHQPLEVDRSRCAVRYVDRLSKDEAIEKFAELRPHFAAVVEPDFLLDLDRSDLSELGPHGFDFFVANDVIEHLANPVRFLENVHKVMRRGAVLFLSVPDSDYTFDIVRDLTTAEHLWEEYERGVATVTTAHLREFIFRTEPGGLPLNPWRRWRLYKGHRERSIHVHVWNQASFDDFLARTCERLRLSFEIINRAGACDTDRSMVYVLRR